MKHFKLFEDFDEEYNGTFVGYHCSPYNITDNYRGKIEDDYHASFMTVLENIKYDFKEAQKYIDDIDEIYDNDIDIEETDILGEIQHFFNENNIEWIYVNKSEPLTKYGDICYEVYFDNFNSVYKMDDELVDSADIYVYISTKNKPVLKEYGY